MASEGLHEDASLLQETTRDRHRATVSLMEELEAIDWYDQRVEATDDPELASILIHNRDDEKEHAAMALEWIRRRDPVLDDQLRLYLFTTDPIVSPEDEPEDAEDDEETSGPGAESSGLGIGSLRGVE